MRYFQIFHSDIAVVYITYTAISKALPVFKLKSLETVHQKNVIIIRWAMSNINSQNSTSHYVNHTRDENNFYLSHLKTWFLSNSLRATAANPHTLSRYLMYSPDMQDLIQRNLTVAILELTLWLWLLKKDVRIQNEPRCCWPHILEEVVAREQSRIYWTEKFRKQFYDNGTVQGLP